jgi:hypothetical protein
MQFEQLFQYLLTVIYKTVPKSIKYLMMIFS